MTLQEAKRKIARIAMGDLIGTSEPPEGCADEYPFNAVAFLKTQPQEWQRELDEVIVYVYHHEELPPGLRGRK